MWCRGLIAGFVFVVIVAGCTGLDVQVSANEDFAALKTLTMQDVRGNPVAFADLVGKKVIVVSFWATFCKPCLGEMPFLQKMHDAHKNEGLAVIGISLDTVETEANVRPFLDANGYTYTVCIDRQSDAANLLNPKSVLPYLLIFDKEGRLNYRKDGFSTGDQPDLQKRIEELLKP